MEHYGIFPKHYGIGYRALNQSSETSRDINVGPHFGGDAICAFQISNIIFSHVIEYDVTFYGMCVFPLLSKMSPTKPSLTLKHRETHGCVVNTVATDALVLKHQAISIHNAD